MLMRQDCKESNQLFILSCFLVVLMVAMRYVKCNAMTFGDFAALTGGETSGIECTLHST